MIKRMVLGLLLVPYCLYAHLQPYHRISESEQLSEATIGHGAPWSLGIVAGLGSFYASGVATQGMLMGRCLVAGAVACAVKTSMYTIVNHAEWPIHAVRIVQGQLDDYMVLSSLRKELVVLNASAAYTSVACILKENMLQERLDDLFDSYKILIQAQFDTLQKFSSRICDDQTNEMIDALEQDFNAITKGAAIDRAAVLNITRGGATSWYRDAIGEPIAALSGTYELHISPLAELYLLCDELMACMRAQEDTVDERVQARILNEHLMNLCQAFQAASIRRQLQFNEAVKHCTRIARVYHVGDCLEAARISIKMSFMHFFGRASH